MWFHTIVQALLLVLALSADAFAASFAYGANRTRIPFSSVLILSGVCSGVLGLSLLLGEALRPWVPERLASILCFGLLFCIGLAKLCDSSIKSLIRRQKLSGRRMRFGTFLLNIYADPEKADRDYSRILSPGEAVSLAIALSLDGLAAGFGAGLSAAGWREPVLLSFVVGICAVRLGCLIGQKLSERLRIDLTWSSGILLMILAFLKL